MQVTVSNLNFGYNKDKLILRNLSFDAKPGETLGILGSSGSGKSTLLRVICGLLGPTKEHQFSGDVLIDGIAGSLPFRDSGAIGFMFQEPALMPNLNVRENIRLPVFMNKNIIVPDFKVSDLVQMVGLVEFESYLPRQLSGGMQTRVALARTFVTNPKLLLLDEPFSSLDYGWKIDLYGKLTALTSTRKSTAIIVSHDIQELVVLCDRILILSRNGMFSDEFFILNNKPGELTPETINQYLLKENEIIITLQKQILMDRQ